MIDILLYGVKVEGLFRQTVLSGDFFKWNCWCASLQCPYGRFQLNGKVFPKFQTFVGIVFSILAVIYLLRHCSFPLLTLLAEEAFDEGFGVEGG